MGGAINLVTSRPTKPFEVEGGLSGGGRSSFEGSNGYMLLGTRQPKFYAQGTVAYSNVDHWTLSSNYTPPPNSLQPAGVRLQSDTEDWHVNAKLGFTPNATDEYTVNYMKQSGEKGAPLNVYNNPPVPPNGYWRWPYWDVQNVSFLSHTQLSPSTYLKTKLYANGFKNGLDAYDDATYTTQSLPGRFSSPYDDHAYGGGAEVGTTPSAADTVKGSFYYRTDVHNQAQTNRPTNPAAISVQPNQRQAQNTWSVALENTLHLAHAVDLVGGVDYEKYDITQAQGYNATTGLFEYPHGGADAVNGQGALVWHYAQAADVHVSVSDRSRFPVIFELYSTRFGTATPNPNLGPERSTNIELGWKGAPASGLHAEGAVFSSRVRDLIQTVVLPDTTTQTQNVGNGRFYGAEFTLDVQPLRTLTAGGNYTFVHREITDALQPNLQPVGVPTHKAFLFATWRPLDRVRLTPNLEVAGDRWSDVLTTPVPAFPYVRTGAYTLLNLDATVAVTRGLDLSAGFKNLTDDNYELAWGFPQPGRSFYIRTRVTF
jgi:iron complex outermembrane receptor protein